MSKIHHNLIMEQQLQVLINAAALNAGVSPQVVKPLLQSKSYKTMTVDTEEINHKLTKKDV